MNNHTSITSVVRFSTPKQMGHVSSAFSLLVDSVMVLALVSWVEGGLVQPLKFSCG